MEPKEQTEKKSGTFYKRRCVIRRGNNMYFPSNVARSRSNLSRYLSGCISVMLYILGNFTSGEVRMFYSSFLQYNFILLSFLGAEILQRINLFIEERKHLESRYENSLFRLFRSAFYFTAPSTIAIIFSIFVIFLGLENVDSISNVCRKISYSSICFICSAYLLKNLLRLEICPVYEALWIENSQGLDYGSGMAYSFFYGYLKLILPKTGTEEKDLRESLMDFAARNGVKFAAYRIFILIPRSLECPVTLSSQHSPSVEASQSLEDKIKTVAGVRDRVYRNSVYKIKAPKSTEKIYVCAEYATPIKTFRDVTMSMNDHAGHYRQLKNDIVLQFYLTLQKVLNENSLHDLCELIYFDDKDEEGTPYDVGQIILSRLRELKKRE